MDPETMMPESSAGDSEHFHFAATLLDFVASGLIVVSASGQILVFDPSAERLTRIRGSEALGRDVSLLPAALQAIVREGFATGRSVPSVEVPLGGLGPVQVSTQVARRPDATILAVVLELQSTAQAREIATNLEHLDRLANLGVLGAAVAHEIKNALVTVRTFVDLLRERNKDDDLAQLVSDEVRRIDAVVKQVLRGATRGEFTLAPVSLHTLLHDVANLVRHQFQARTIQLEMNLNTSSDTINGDERQLRHAFLNLIINALEAVPNSGRVIIRTATATVEGRPAWRVTIADTGSGIRPEHLPHIFDPFFTTKKEGTGLGLAITRRIVRAHGGTIEVQSTPGEGTAFEVSLPLLPPTAA